MPNRQYRLESHFLIKGKGWQTTVEVLESTYEAAARQASREAHRLDEIYGDDHFWTVDLKNTVGESYFQLFHGRLS